MTDRHATAPCRWEIRSTAPQTTRRLGYILGSLAPGGTLLTLDGQLGAGKTTLIQGLARGLEVPETYYITSPTFTLINEYPGRLTLYHVDLYRIGDPEEAVEIGLEEIMAGNGVVAIEWAGRLGHLLPAGHLRIDLKTATPGEREIAVNGFGAAARNLVEAARSKWRSAG